MKSINTKISIIIIVGFIIQIILIGSLYKIVLVKQVIASVNQHEVLRQEIEQVVVSRIQNTGDNMAKVKEILRQYSQKYDVNFTLKDMNGNVVATAVSAKKTTKDIQEVEFVKFKAKPQYELYSQYPVKLRNFTQGAQGSRTMVFFLIVIFTVSLAVSFLIYEVLALPLKKLKKAMEDINYGNTVVEIPYYANDELGVLCRKFEEMGRRLKSAEDNQVEVIQAISHDLKTPLTSISGYIQRLIDGKVLSEEKKKEYYGIVYRKATDIKALMEELDEYVNINGSGKYEKTVVECRNFFEDICMELKEETNHKGASFEYANKLEDDYRINIDLSKIRRVFGNIIANSIKYAGEQCFIKAECLKDKDNILFKIQDNGPGVPDEELARIFDKFYRVETSRSREKGGTGLGLAISKGIIEAHGGKIGAGTGTEGGLLIHFTIPIYNNDEKRG